jgi:hypothetical protein
MKHLASQSFWEAYQTLPERIQQLAVRTFDILKTDPRYPALHFKKIGRYWSVRIGLHYRALAVEVDEGPLWFWIGSHADYDRLIDNQ